jgi:hypothetical protein
MPVVDLVAALAQEIADHVLTRPFSAASRGDRDKIPGGRELRIEIGINGVEDFLLGVAGNHVVIVPVTGVIAGLDQTILSPDLQAPWTAFRIAAASIE